MKKWDYRVHSGFKQGDRVTAEAYEEVFNRFAEMEWEFDRLIDTPTDQFVVFRRLV